MEETKSLAQLALPQVLGEIGDGILLTDDRENVVYMNAAAKAILHLEGDVQGEKFSDICPLVDLATGREFAGPLQEVMAEGRPKGLARNVGLLLGGAPHYLSATCSPIFSEGEEHKVVGCSIILRDVTRIRGLELKHEVDETQLRIAKSEAEQAAGTKARFLSNMSHEIRTPINGILGMMDLAMREPLTEYQTKCLRRAHGRAHDLLQLLDDILDFSRLEAGKLTLSSIRFDVHQVIRHLISVYKREAEKKGLTFTLEEPKDLPRFAVGDSRRLRQIFRALISNALKFTSKGSVRVGGFLGTHNGKKTLDFFVHDTGIGMGRVEQKLLFRPFSQGDNSATRRYGGTGVGLILVRDILALMHGGISVQSSMGIGTKILFWIPYEAARSADEEFRERGVYINPLRGTKQKTKKRDASVEALIAYCNAKYSRFQKDKEKGADK